MGLAVNAFHVLVLRRYATAGAVILKGNKITGGFLNEILRQELKKSLFIILRCHLLIYKRHNVHA